MCSAKSEWRSRAQRREIKMARSRGRNISERFATPDRGRLDRTKCQDRNLFASVIGARPGRIAPMIRRYDCEIIRSKRSFELRQPGIERLQGSRVSADVATVAVQSIEVDEIREQKAPVGQGIHALQRSVKQLLIPGCLQYAARAGVREDVPDLAHGDDGAACIAGAIEDGRRRRRYRVIPPI